MRTPVVWQNSSRTDRLVQNGPLPPSPASRAVRDSFTLEDGVKSCMVEAIIRNNLVENTEHSSRAHKYHDGHTISLAGDTAMRGMLWWFVVRCSTRHFCPV